VHDTLGRARGEDGVAATLGQLTNVIGAEAIDILFVGDGRGDVVLGDVARQGELDEDAVDRGIVVQAAELVQQLGLSDLSGVVQQLTRNTSLSVA